MKFKDGGTATAKVEDVADDGEASRMRVVLAVNVGLRGNCEVYCTATNARALAAELIAAADRLDKATRKPAR